MKIQNQYLLIFIFFIALTFISCDKDDDKVELSKEGLTNYCELNIDGKSYLLIDSFNVDIVGILGSSYNPRIFYVSGSDKTLCFEWTKQDSRDEDTFSIAKGYYIDRIANIKTENIDGYVVVDTFKYLGKGVDESDEFVKSRLLLVGKYVIQVILPNNSKKYINGKFRYDGEYESWL